MTLSGMVPLTAGLASSFIRRWSAQSFRGSSVTLMSRRKASSLRGCSVTAARTRIAVPRKYMARSRSFGTCPLRVVEDAGRVERDGLGGFGDHAFVGDDEVGARCWAWQPEVIVRPSGTSRRILAHAGLLALESTGEAERAAAVADFRLDVDAHPRGSVDHLMPRAHGLVSGCGGRERRDRARREPACCRRWPGRHTPAPVLRPSRGSAPSTRSRVSPRS